MSYYDYEDYYGEPNEFEQQIEEFKSTLYDCVKHEHKMKMERLEKENTELQEVKKNWNTLENEYKNKLHDLQCKIDTAERDAKRLRLNGLMQELKQYLWQANSISVYNKKCDKCDDKRQIHFISPSGKDMTEDCECSKSIAKYIPKEYELYSFQQNTNEIGRWYKKRYPDSDYYENDSKYVELLVKTEEDFKLIGDRLWQVFFVSEELCKKYCEQRNITNGVTEEMTTEKCLNNQPKRCK